MGGWPQAGAGQERSRPPDVLPGVEERGGLPLGPLYRPLSPQLGLASAGGTLPGPHSQPSCEPRCPVDPPGPAPPRSLQPPTLCLVLACPSSECPEHAQCLPWAQMPSTLSQTDPERPAGPLARQGLAVLRVAGRVSGWVDRWRVGRWMWGWMFRGDILLSECVNYTKEESQPLTAAATGGPGSRGHNT